MVIEFANRTFWCACAAASHACGLSYSAATVWFWPVNNVINKTVIVIFQALFKHPKNLCPLNAAAASNPSWRGQGHHPDAVHDHDPEATRIGAGDSQIGARVAVEWLRPCDRQIKASLRLLSR